MSSTSFLGSIGDQPLLAPAIALGGWTLVVEVWMYALRIPAIGKYKVNADPKIIKTEMATKIPPHLEYPAQNFNHLHEQPTQFYATLLAANALGMKDNTTVSLAYLYVALRIVHSLIQCTSNVIMTRFKVFASSSVVLAAITARVAQKIWF